uniref:dystrotelin n=1 Tax=Euleptes europaea TaxID=460621 RepID=UPI002540A6DA|nr:dystrotelin [Euleptes europaea]
MDIDQQEALNSIQNSVYRAALKLRAVQTLCQLHLTDVSLIYRILPICQCQTEKQASLPSQRLLVLLEELFERVRYEKPGQVEPKAPELTLSLLTAAYDRNGVGLIQPRSTATALITLSGDSLLAKYRALFRLYATSPGRKSSRGVHITRNGVRNLLTDLQQILSVVGESRNLACVESAVGDCFSGVLVAAIGEEKFLSWLQAEPAILLWLPACYRLSATELVVHPVKCNICKTFPIMGLRYQCLKCLNFDICQVCFYTGQSSKPHKKSHPVIEHCVPVSAKENTKLFFRTVRNNLFQGRCRRKEARRRKALMMSGEDFPSHNSALSSSVPLIFSEQPAHPKPFSSVPALGPSSSRPLGQEVFQAQQMENCNKPQAQEDTSGQVLASVKAELIKTQESVKALRGESRYLMKQLNKWKCKAQLLHSTQEDRNCRLQAKICDLIAIQEHLTVELQKVKQEIKVPENAGQVHSGCQVTSEGRKNHE